MSDNEDSPVGRRRTSEHAEALRERLRAKGYTPGARDREALFELTRDADPKIQSAARRGLRSLGPGLVRAWIAGHLDARNPELGPELLRAMAPSLAKHSGAFDGMVALLDAEAPRVRRAAARAMAQAFGEAATEALAARLGVESSLPELRAIVEALGDVGDRTALDAILEFEATRADAPADAELQRRIELAKLKIRRSADRPGERIALASETGPGEWRVVFKSREGLESLVATALERSGTHVRDVRPGRVHATVKGAFAIARAPRFALLAGLDLGELPFDASAERSASVDDAFSRTVAERLAGDDVAALLSALSSDPVVVARARIHFTDGRHRRSVAWRIAAAIEKLTPRVRSDPTASDYVLEIQPDGERVWLTLVPRWADPRFAYRVADWPAASHPTLAAALVEVAGIDDRAIVWDPFVGSGLELCESFVASSRAKLIGSDLDPKAVACARRNLEALGAGAELGVVDALSHAPPGITHIITNPPMGRRVPIAGGLAPFLRAFIAQASRVLGPGGRLVWISPLPDETKKWAEIAKFACTTRQLVDMCGFWGELQAFELGSSKPRTHGSGKALEKRR